MFGITRKKRKPFEVRLKEVIRERNDRLSRRAEMIAKHMEGRNSGK